MRPQTYPPGEPGSPPPLKSEPGWMLALMGLAVVMLACGGAVL